MKTARVWRLALLGAASLLAGCAADVAMVNPRTDETAVCTSSLRGLDPWSQQEACIAHYIASGWIRAEHP